MKTVVAGLFLCSVALTQEATLPPSSRHCDPTQHHCVLSVAVSQQAAAAKSPKHKVEYGKKTPVTLDEETIKWMDDYEKNRRNLYWALRTRVLTDKEMDEVEAQDYSLLVPIQGYSMDVDKVKAEFNQALLQQYKIRDIANRGCAPK